MGKIGAGILGVGSVATSGVFLYKELSKPQTHLIKDLLISKNPEKRLISESNDGSTVEWKAAGKSYREAYKDKSSNPFSLTSEQLKDSSPDLNAPSEFMGGCRSLSVKTVIDDKDERYQTIFSYCTRDTLIKDLVLESGRVLNDETNGGGSAGGKDYRKVNESKDKDTGQLTDWDTKKNDDNTISEDLKKKCESKLADKTEGKVSDDYKNIVSWCSKPKGK